MQVEIPYDELTPAQKLRALWADFCDAEMVPPGFDTEMEVAGFIDMDTASADDVDGDSFAYDRGIEEGGPIWRLTDAGRAALAGGSHG